MALGKRKYTTGRGKTIRGRKVSASYATRAKRARTSGRTGYANIVRVSNQVNRLSSMIETKEATLTSPVNVALGHNKIHVVEAATGGELNPLYTTQAATDPMSIMTGSRLGDRLSIRGLAIRGFVENALNRSKVYYRIMLIKCPRGVSPTIANTLYKGCCGNKMIDQINTEKFTVVWQTSMNVMCANNPPVLVNVDGTPASGGPAGIGTRIFKAWIPGSKICRGGNLQYENGTSIPKFFDYRIAICVYDWYGTPDAVANTVGRLNEMYVKMYFKDA